MVFLTLTYKIPVTNISNILRVTGTVRRTIDTQSRSQKLMLTEGLINPGYSGSVFLLPMAVKALEKLIAVVDASMNKIDAQKVIMPTLIPKTLLTKTGRWEKLGSELLTLRDRNQKELCLSPTHEEPVTDLVIDFYGNLVPRSVLPLKIYQITTKFRDEERVKHGLLRGREFLMKDLYSFHKDKNSAEETFNQVSKAYEDILNALELPFYKVEGSPGNMGGSFSQEMHVLTDIGEDDIYICRKCNVAINAELNLSGSNCSQCGSEVEKRKAVEVGHMFLLGDTYSKPFDAKFCDESGNTKLLYMGCYGFGLTRALATVIECLSTETSIRWPKRICPYLLAVIPPKEGSKEMTVLSLAHETAERLSKIPQLNGNVAFDDRTTMTVGARTRDLKASGFPYLLLVAKKALESVPKFELIDVYNDKTCFLTHAETMEFFQEVANQQED